MARISRGGFANQLKKIPFSSTPMGRWGGIVAYQDGGRRSGLGVHLLDRRPLHFGGCLDGRHESSMLPPAPRGGVSVVPKTNAVFLQTFAQTIGRAPVRSFAGCLTPGHEAFDGRARKKRGPHFPTRLAIGFDRHVQNTENVATDIAPIRRRGSRGSPKGAIAVGDRCIERSVEFPGCFKKCSHTAGNIPVRCQMTGKSLPEKTLAAWRWREAPEDGLQPMGQSIDAVQLYG